NHIDLIAKSLPVIERITEMETLQKISPEQAEILRRQVVGGCKKFSESGAMIPEISEAAVINPRVLLAPEPKLLVGPELSQTNAPEGVAQETSVIGEEGLENLSPEERNMLKRLLQKGKKPRNGPIEGTPA